MHDRHPETTVRQVHNGMVALIGRVQLLRRRLERLDYDRDKIDPDLTTLETLTRRIERRVFQLLEQDEHRAPRQIPTTPHLAKQESETE